MVVRGAPAIGCAAAFGIALEAQRLRAQSTEAFVRGMNEAFDVLSRSRPTAVNLFWALGRMRSVLDAMQGQPAGNIAAKLLEAPSDYCRDLHQSHGATAATCWLTARGAHPCNAGGPPPDMELHWA
jgi:methylthioribose-1-phosphate isomerase